MPRVRHGQAIEAYAGAGSNRREQLDLALQGRTIPTLLTVDGGNCRFDLAVTPRPDSRFRIVGLFRPQSLQTGGTTRGQIRRGRRLGHFLCSTGATARSRTPAGQSQQSEQQGNDKWQPELQ